MNLQVDHHIITQTFISCIASCTVYYDINNLCRVATHTCGWSLINTSIYIWFELIELNDIERRVLLNARYFDNEIFSH